MTRGLLLALVAVVLLPAFLLALVLVDRSDDPAPVRVVTTSHAAGWPGDAWSTFVVPETTTTTQKPKVVLVPKARTAPNGSIWDALQQCECPPGWHCNTGNGYFGGLQMDAPFWETYGGLEFAPRPDLATREQQIIVAERGRADRGYTPWPTCARRLGLIA